MVSTDGGANFTNSGFAGTGGSRIVRTVPGAEGHLWIALYTGGLKRSVNSGASFTTLSNVTHCTAVGLGKAADGSNYHTVYIWGTVGGVTGIFRSADQGVSWTRINDDAHEYGGPGNGQFVIGDMNEYGRVYMSTVGRGIVYGEIVTPTPIQLLSFTATAENGEVLLSWSTASEIRNKHFILEKSADGKEFVPLQVLPGAGSTSSLQHYRTTDPDPFPGQNYYRLVQEDYDGQRTYYTAKTLTFSPSFSWSLYPNPTGNQCYISIPESIQGLEIRDVAGHLVYQQKDIIPPGEIPLTLDHLAKGWYLLRIYTQKKSHFQYFIKE